MDVDRDLPNRFSVSSWLDEHRRERTVALSGELVTVEEMSSERDRFQEIADQILRDDPRFVQRASKISGHERPARVQIRRIGAILSFVIGFPVMVAAIAMNLPPLGLLAFIGMLAATLPAARDLAVTFRNSKWERLNEFWTRNGD